MHASKAVHLHTVQAGKLGALPPPPQLRQPLERWRLAAVPEEEAAEAVREFEELEFASLLAPLRTHLARLGGQ